MIFDVDFSESNQVFDLDFQEQSSDISLEFGQVIEIIKSDADPYTGDYSVTPSIEGETLETRGKYMREDVTVKPIPYYNVSNTSGGTTVYIAKEL